MSTNKEKIGKRIRNNIIWIIIFTLLLILTDSKFWSTFSIVFLILHSLSLINNYINYIHQIQKDRQKEFDEHMYNFKKSVDDWAKRIYEQQYKQKVVKKSSFDIISAYKLMKLDLTDDVKTIKKRYRELALVYHPDKYVNKSKTEQESANRNFQKLNNAYSVIKNYKNFI